MDRKEVEKARSVSRNSRFALNSSHENLKKLITKREAELENLISEYKANQKTNFAIEMKMKKNISQVSNSTDGDNSTRMARARMIRKDSGDEVELDLSMIKANKRRRRSSRSPFGSKATNHGESTGTRSRRSSKNNCSN